MLVSPDALQRYIREENMPPFDAVARLCAAAGVRMEWLATGDGEQLVDLQPPSRQERLDPATLAQAVSVLQGYLEEQDLDLSHADFGEAVLKIYDGLKGGNRAFQRAVADLSEYRVKRNRG